MIEPLWIAGLAIACLFVGSLFGLAGESFDWTEYLLLGTVFPALLITLALADARRPRMHAPLSNMKLGLALFLLAFPVIELRYRNFKYVLVISLVQYFITSQYLKRAGEAHDVDVADVRRKLLRAVPLLFVIVMAWVAASRYIWWVTYEEFILGSNLAFIIFALSLLLVIWNLFDQVPVQAQEETRDRRQLIANILAVLLIAMASIRTDHIFGLGEIHHWSFFTGPAQMVRQGEWLLWDVPSQYGFLVTLTLAWLPTKTVWQSLFLVNALVNFLIALMLFSLFRALRPGFLNLCFALALTLAAVFFRSGLAPFYFEGPSQLPNIGGLRFCWSFALAAILFLEYRRASMRDSHYRALLWAGCGVWLTGTLWSAESALYAGATWLPAFALLVWRRTAKVVGATETSFKRRLLASVRWLLLPPGLLVASVLLIVGVYLLRLGHAPDWRSFIEYAQAYKGGFAAIPIDVNGAVWVLVIVFCAFATTAAYILRDDAGHAALPLMLGAGGGLWAMCSYFVSRSHPNNVHNLGMVFCGAIGLVLYLLARERREEWWTALVKASFVPILTVVLVAVFANKVAVTDYLFTPQASYMQVEKLIPLSAVELDLLLNSAEVQPDDPMVYIGPNEVFILSAWTFKQGERSEVLTTYKSWLPVPLYSLVPLPEERRMLYLSRFSSRVRRGGWLIEYKREGPPLFPWLAEYLSQHYTAGRSFEDATWRLTWYDYKG
ncbi:MAG TPA: hypothetical protein VF544_06110 [Pyrinomonadaceae bacterium]